MKAEERGRRMEIGKEIARLRKENGISQEKLAEILGVSRQAVTKWESGKTNPDTENLMALAKVFGVSIDNLCKNESRKQPKAKIHPGGHIFAAVSVLIVTAYCIIGGISGRFSGGTLICSLILAFPMEVFLHLILWGMIKSGDFSMLAGYDPKVKYNDENMKSFIAGLDFSLGFTTAGYLFMITSASLAAPEFGIMPLLLMAYVLSFTAMIMVMGYKFSDKIYADPKDAKNAKRGFPASVILMVMMLLSVGAFIVIFELKGYENNTAEPLPMLGLMLLSIGFSLAGYFIESARLKKEEEPVPFFGKWFIILNAAAFLSILLMAMV